MPQKDIARLIPVKKLVTNAKTGSINDETYYTAPPKNVTVKTPATPQEPTPREPSVGSVSPKEPIP